jgi:hypothetical protein
LLRGLQEMPASNPKADELCFAARTTLAGQHIELPALFISSTAISEAKES